MSAASRGHSRGRPDFNDPRGGGGRVLCPRVHQVAMLLDEIRPAIGGLGLISHGVRQGRFADCAREMRPLLRPVAKRGTEPMCCDVPSTHPAQRHQEHHVRQRPRGTTAWKNLGSAIGEPRRLLQNLDAAWRQRHAMLAPGLHPGAGHRLGSGQHSRHRHSPARRAPARLVHIFCNTVILKVRPFNISIYK